MADESFIRGVWHGATRPSPTALVGTLAVTATCFAIAAATIDTDTIRTLGPSAWADDGHDEYAWFTAGALELSDIDAPSVVLFGGSGVRETISDENDIAEVVHEMTGVRPRVFDLGSGGQTLWETARAAEEIPADARAVVVLGVSPLRYARGPDDLAYLLRSPRMGLSGGVLDREAELADVAVPWRVGNAFVDNRGFFLPRVASLARNALLGPPDRVRHFYIDYERLDPTTIPDEWLFWREAYHQHADTSEAVHERLIADLRARPGVRVVLWAPPLDPTFFPVGDPAHAAYEAFGARIAPWAAARDLPLLHIDAEADLTTDDFYDWTHLRRPDAQRRATRALAAHLAPLVAEVAGGAP